MCSFDMRFSVIIPVWNVAPYLKECLDSVIVAVNRLSGGSHEKNIPAEVEVVCVDDGSTDGSGAIIDHCCAKDPRIKVIHQRNKGVSEARNVALSVSSGDWILFVDGDDKIAENTFERLVSVIASCPAVDIIAFDFLAFADGEEPIVCESSDSNQTIKNIADALGYSEVCREMWQNCFRRSVVLHRGFRPYRSGEDLLFLAESLSLANVLVKINDELYYYRIRSGSADHSGISARKIYDTIGYNMERLKVLIASNKRIDNRVIKHLCNKLSEETCWALRYVAREEADMLWKLLLETWAKLPKIKAIGFRRRIKFFILASFHNRLIALVCLVIPYMLKRRWYLRRD